MLLSPFLNSRRRELGAMCNHAQQAESCPFVQAGCRQRSARTGSNMLAAPHSAAHLAEVDCLSPPGIGGHNVAVVVRWLPNELHTGAELGRVLEREPENGGSSHTHGCPVTPVPGHAQLSAVVQEVLELHTAAGRSGGSSQSAGAGCCSRAFSAIHKNHCRHVGVTRGKILAGTA